MLNDSLAAIVCWFHACAFDPAVMFGNIVDVDGRTYAKLPWQLDPPPISAMRCRRAIAEAIRSAFLPSHAENGRLVLRKADSDSSTSDFLIARRFTKAALEFLIGEKLCFL